MALATLRPRSGATDTLTNEDLWQSVGNYDPEFKDAVAAQVQELAALPENWDSYGAPPISSEIIDTAVKFIRSLPEHIASRPHVVPMSPGNLQLEWHSGPKILELEFENPKSIRFLQWNGDHDFSVEDTFSVTDIDRAVDLIQWFMIS